MSKAPYTKADAKAFAAAQARYKAAQDREQSYRMDVLWEKYRSRAPSRSWMTRGEAKRIDSFHTAETRAIDAMFRVLDRVATRSWSVGAPCDWIMTELTIEDATTPGALSVIPPLAFAQTERDRTRFCAEVS